MRSSARGRERRHRLSLHAEGPLSGDVNISIMMYHHEVRRLQISIDEDLDEALAVEAARRHTSRAAVIRELVRQQLPTKHEADPFAPLIGDIDDAADDIDEVVYGR